MSRRQRPGARRYTVVDDLTREAVIDAVIARIEAGDSFTAAARAAALGLEVAETTVRTWVNRSGRRPRRTERDVAALEAELAMARELNRELARKHGVVTEDLSLR